MIPGGKKVAVSWLSGSEAGPTFAKNIGSELLQSTYGVGAPGTRSVQLLPFTATDYSSYVNLGLKSCNGAALPTTVREALGIVESAHQLRFKTAFSVALA